MSTLLPVRYHISAIGGSQAQQDVVNITLIDAALRLPDHVRPVVETGTIQGGGGGFGSVPSIAICDAL